MKKIYFVLFASALILFSSCGKDKDNGISNIDTSTLDNTVEKCWAITVTSTVESSESGIVYNWGTERFIVETLQETYKMAAGVVKFHWEESKATDAESCIGKNDDVE